MRPALKIWAAVLSVALMAGLPGSVHAQAGGDPTPAEKAGDRAMTPQEQKELDALFQQVLANPANTEANLRYARAAERFGQIRKAMSTYERVAINDPANVEAKVGFERLKMYLEPPATRYRLAIGMQFETNASAVNSQISPVLQGFQKLNGSPDGAAVASLRIDDDRQFGDVRWFTRAILYGEKHIVHSKFDYDFGSINSGPAFVLDNGWIIRGGPAAEVGFQGYNYLYWSAGAAGELLIPQPSAFRSVRFGVLKADFTQASDSKDGVVFYAQPEFGWDHVLTHGDTFLIEPYTSYYMAFGHNHQDRYYLLGMTVTHALPIADQFWGFKHVFFVTMLNAEWRPYAGHEPLPPNLNKGNRMDWRLQPGVRIVGTNLLDREITAVLSYDFDRARSNYDSYAYNNHKFALNFIFGF